jgi:hypothetical protein
MSKNISYPASVIAARGRKITLLDDTEVTLVYGFASLMRVESDFGSFTEALRSLGGGDRPISTNGLAKLVAAGLLHEGHPTEGALGDPEHVAGLLDTMRIASYVAAISDALVEAFPQASKGEHVDEDPTEGDESSPGLSGTTSEPSSSVDESVSSGV